MMIVAFPDNNFKGEIAPALAELVESGTIRILDLAFVMKDADGKVAALEVEDLDSKAALAFQVLQLAIGELVSAEDLEQVGNVLEPNQSALLLVWEDVWATKVATAMANAGGVLLSMDRVPRDVVVAALEAAGVPA
jgi:uncharacterized membrane protein